MGVERYGNTAALNNTTGTGTLEEGISPSLVNNRYRELLEDLRDLANNQPWIEIKSQGQAFNESGFTFASSTSISDGSGVDLTAVYHVGRRIRCVGSTTGDIVGTITASSFSSPNNTVTISFDSGSLTNETLDVFLGPNRTGALPDPYDRQVFTSSGSWTKPAGLKFIVVHCIGAGGGSGGSPGAGSGQAESGGGGGGAYSSEKILASALSSSETVTIGAAGTAGTHTTSGGNGGDTTFGTSAFLTAGGGSGSVVGVNTTGNSILEGGDGGTASNGDINIDGSHGAPGVVISGQRLTNNKGGTSGMGYGHGGLGLTGTGEAGQNFGGGAQGTGATTTNNDGAAGAAGLVIVEEYFV
jgi:hypothetical protein